MSEIFGPHHPVHTEREQRPIQRHTKWDRAWQALAVLAIITAASTLLIDDPTCRRILLAFTCVSVITTVAYSAHGSHCALQGYRDIVVLDAVHHDPGHCAVTYTNATGLPFRAVKKTLRRLTTTGHLETKKIRHLDELPLVNVYRPSTEP